MTTRRLDGAIGRPAPPLRGFIDRYRGYWYEGFLPGTHRGLPSRHLTLIVTIDDEVDIVAMPDPGQTPEAFDAFVGGLHASPARIRHDGSQRGIHVDVTPLGARALLGMPAGAITSTIVHLRDVLGSRANELVDRLGTAHTWAERFAALDDVFARALVQPRDPPAEVVWAWQRILETGGTITVAELADEVGWSRRHLGERFRTEVGLSPKVAARVVRFERARRLLARTPRPSLADVAAVCGYFDQAHMTREFNELAGCSPAAWLAEELGLPSIQDGELVGVSG